MQHSRLMTLVGGALMTCALACLTGCEPADDPTAVPRNVDDMTGNNRTPTTGSGGSGTGSTTTPESPG